MAQENYLDKEFIEYILGKILTHPEAVEVNRTVDELGVLITVKVHEEDMGTIIGKSGQTAKALRTILRVIGSKNQARVNLKILDTNKEPIHSESLSDQLENIDA